ncbi:NADPH-dependent FMN reductase [Leucobacter soli]|uniref:NADPH-dependent FMN reductase n=1 Tax=Leucobacter soli TaxID=2812850 RepID=UPI00360C2EC9
MSDQTSRDQINIVAISCSPFGGGKTRTAIEAVLSGAAAAGARTTLIELGEDPGSPPDYEAAVEAIRAADGIAFGSPMYRATYTQQFKALTEAIPRTPDDAPLAGRAVTTVATAGSDHHMLGMSGMRDILVDFFAAHLVSPGLFVSPAGFDGRRCRRRCRSAPRPSASDSWSSRRRSVRRAASHGPPRTLSAGGG